MCKSRSTMSLIDGHNVQLMKKSDQHIPPILRLKGMLWKPAKPEVITTTFQRVANNRLFNSQHAKAVEKEPLCFLVNLMKQKNVIL